MKNTEANISIGRDQALVLFRMIDRWEKTGSLPVCGRAENRALLDLFGAIRVQILWPYRAEERQEIEDAEDRLGAKVDLMSFTDRLIDRWETYRSEHPEEEIAPTYQTASEFLESFGFHYQGNCPGGRVDAEGILSYVLGSYGGIAWEEMEEYIDRLLEAWREDMTFPDFCDTLAGVMRGAGTPEPC